MIHEIRIRGFRGIREGRIDGFRRINIFVGPNNAGKSTVIEALYLGNTAGRHAGLVLEDDTDDSREMRIEAYDARISQKDFLGCDPLEKILNRHGLREQSPEVNRLEQGILKVQVREGSPPGIPSKFEPLRYFQMDGGKSGTLHSRDRGLSLFAIDAARDYREPDRSAPFDLAGRMMGEEVASLDDARIVFCWHPDLTYFGSGSACWSIRGRASVRPHAVLFDANMAMQHIVPEFHQYALGGIPGWTQGIAQRFGSIFDMDPASFTVQFAPVPGSERWIQAWIAPKNRPALPIDVFGDGARSAFKLLTPLVALAETATPDEPGLILWEEPESFQNPLAMSRLLSQIVDLVRDKPIQLFCATHSLEVVAHFTRMLRNADIPSDDARLFQLHLSDGALTSSWFDRDNLVAWLESGLDPRVWGDFFPPVRFFLREDEE
jgi:hypothetical protein